MLITKGAPEGILALSVAYESDGQRRAAGCGGAASAVRRHFDDLSRAGASGCWPWPTPMSRRAPNYSGDDENNLILAGFLTFSDPPLPDAAEALAALRREGVEVKIITGDGDLVTAHVCGQVGPRCGQDRARR